MPKIVSEIAPGMNFDYTKEENRPAITSARVFRILKNAPDEAISLTSDCNVKIGDEHPRIPGIYCYHYSGAYEGESRMSILATFDYRLSPSANGQDPNQDPPDLRPANWYTSTSLMEVPAYTWDATSRAGVVTVPGIEVTNPAGDLYEGVTKLVPIVTITVDQWEGDDPTRNNEHAGKINSVAMRIGSLNVPRACLMFRGVQTKPAVESWGDAVYRGWQASYEFLFKRNRARFSDQDTVQPDWFTVGWDHLQPVAGFNCKAFDPANPNAQQDPYGQPLKWDNDGVIVAPLALPDGVAAGDKMRAHVKVGVRGGKQGQRPSAQSVPLNNANGNIKGTPRAETAVPKVLIERYRVAEEMNFADLNLRLY